jgi:beta-ketodecanoyl-[acyl-carrier-protein] synthase
MKPICISGSGLFTPALSLSNDELVAAYNQYAENFNLEHAAEIEAGTVAAVPASSSEFIVKASGIQARHVMDREGILDPKRMRPKLPLRGDDEPSILAEIAIAAARQALERSGRKPEDIDGVIVGCSNLQRAYPAIAIEVQHYLGISGFAFDMNVACATAPFALQAAADAVANGSARAVLAINPEICSGHNNFRNRDCHFIFGDAATATVVESLDNAVSPAPFEILGTRIKTQFSNNIRNNFGFLNSAEEPQRLWHDVLFHQEGRKVFKEVVPMVSELISSHLQSLGIESANLKRMWLHQANVGMNEYIARKVLGRDATRREAPLILDEYANTSSAGSVIAFHKFHDDFASGDVGVLCAFGAGYSAGSVVLRRV